MTIITKIVIYMMTMATTMSIIIALAVTETVMTENIINETITTMAVHPAMMVEEVHLPHVIIPLSTEEEEGEEMEILQVILLLHLEAIPHLLQEVVFLGLMIRA